MGFTRQKSRAGANPESPARTQPGTNIREVHNNGRTVSTREHNGLFIQQNLRYSQKEKGDEFDYLVLVLNNYLTEDYMKR